MSRWAGVLSSMNFKTIDDKILAQCTKVAHAFQRYTGKTTYTLAKIGIYIAAIGVIMEVFNYFHKFLETETNAVDFVVNFILFLYLVWCSSLCIKAEDEAAISSDIKPRKLIGLGLFYDSYVWRLYWVAAFLIFFTVSSFRLVYITSFKLVDAIDVVSFQFGFMLFYYFIVVNPLPPGTNRIREWITNLEKARCVSQPNFSRTGWSN
jgi:hypothetical protein